MSQYIEKYFPNLTVRQREQYDALPGLYAEWNAKINVISRKDIDSLEQRHVLHSLAIARTELIVSGQSVLDVGCGGGFPGIPLAIYYPDVNFTLVDSIGKKIHVVEQVAAALGLTNLSAVKARAEELPDSYDWVVSRAVTDLRTFVGWTWNSTRNGIIYLKGGDLEQEIRSANRHTIEHSVNDWFADEFFETKKVLVLPKK